MRIKNIGLPYVVTPHDYKANNLISTPNPYLIDPDNAKWLPRIFDLTLVLHLFHNELSSAPDVIFTPKQWMYSLPLCKKAFSFISFPRISLYSVIGKGIN